MVYRAVVDKAEFPENLRWNAASLWAGPNCHPRMQAKFFAAARREFVPIEAGMPASAKAQGIFLPVVAVVPDEIASAALLVQQAVKHLSGAQVGANALSAGFYPTASRATGVSWASGIGRIGSVLGSMAGGWMLALGWSLPLVFAAVGVPALVAALGITLMGRTQPVVSAAH